MPCRNICILSFRSATQRFSPQLGLPGLKSLVLAFLRFSSHSLDTPIVAECPLTSQQNDWKNSRRIPTLSSSSCPTTQYYSCLEKNRTVRRRVMKVMISAFMVSWTRDKTIFSFPRCDQLYFCED